MLDLMEDTAYVRERDITDMPDSFALGICDSLGKGGFLGLETCLDLTRLVPIELLCCCDVDP